MFRVVADGSAPALLNAKTWARPFTARLLEPGLVSYEDRGCGIALLRKQTIDRDIHNFIGRPVIIKHSSTSPANMKEVGHGYVTEVFYNATDGWWYGKGVVDTDEAAEEINRRGFCSVGYKPTKNGPGGSAHDMKYDEEILGFTGLHLAIVGNPRYEEATIRLNSKNKTNMTIKWVKKIASAMTGGGDDAAKAAAALAAKTKADADAAALLNAKNDGAISGETTFEIPGAEAGKTVTVALNDLIEAYNGKSDMDGEDEITCNGKTYKLNALLQAFDKWEIKNATDAEDAKKKEKENGKAKVDHFKVLENAAARAPQVVVQGPTGSLEEGLALGRKMFGTAK